MNKQLPKHARSSNPGLLGRLVLWLARLVGVSVGGRSNAMYDVQRLRAELDAVRARVAKEGHGALSRRLDTFDVRLKGVEERHGHFLAEEVVLLTGFLEMLEGTESEESLAALSDGWEE